MLTLSLLPQTNVTKKKHFKVINTLNMQLVISE